MFEGRCASDGLGAVRSRSLSALEATREVLFLIKFAVFVLNRFGFEENVERGHGTLELERENVIKLLHFDAVYKSLDFSNVRGVVSVVLAVVAQLEGKDRIIVGNSDVAFQLCRTTGDNSAVEQIVGSDNLLVNELFSARDSGVFGERKRHELLKNRRDANISARNDLSDLQGLDLSVQLHSSADSLSHLSDKLRNGFLAQLVRLVDVELSREADSAQSLSPHVGFAELLLVECLVQVAWIHLQVLKLIRSLRVRTVLTNVAVVQTAENAILRDDVAGRDGCVVDVELSLHGDDAHLRQIVQCH